MYGLGRLLRAGDVMSGPAPKPAELRRRRNAPAGGEWVDLPELETPVLPPLPAGDWSEHSIAMWDAWRADRATSQYTPADIGYALETIRVADSYHRGGPASLVSELRLRMDGLGLTPKGKHNLRWRVTTQAEAVGDRPERLARSMSSRRRRLRAVDPAAKSA
jgi:hypothetical protein